MRIPKSPPKPEAILDALLKDESIDQIEKADKLAMILGQKIVDAKGRYLHWDKMRYLEPPLELSRELWWAGTRFARRSAARETPFSDLNGETFKYCITEQIERDLHWIDINAAGNFEAASGLGVDGRDSYIIRSLVEEAISSSQLEGASTTRHIAKDMIRKGRGPLDKSERMILNNYRAMQFIREIREERLSIEILIEIHRILMDGTLSNDKVGRFRMSSDEVYVEDFEGKILHMPPDASTLGDSTHALLAYANKHEDRFVHPVLKAIILHFMMGYIHPFVDGNGRTARALFYWAMAREKYWLIEYVSISTAIQSAPVQYGQAYLFTESDSGDLTYFLVNQLKMIIRAIEEFKERLEYKLEETGRAKSLLEASNRFKKELSFRQISILKHAIRHPGHRYSIEEHKNSHGVTYETARRDLLTMADVGLLEKVTVGRKFLFVAPNNMYELLQLSEEDQDKRNLAIKNLFA